MKFKIKNKIVWVIFGVFFALFFLFESALSIKVKADDTANVYTDVMTDLTKSGTFNVEDYPAIADPENADMYSLQLIKTTS